jgi:diguanylate cyclase (GGDEF)-like protein
LLLIDVDHFKTINDTHGHAAGDAVLATVAQRLHSCVFDLDLVARLGGDEFAILIEHDASAKTVEQVAARIIKAMSRAIQVDGALLPITLSVGATFCVGSDIGEKELFGTADRALYTAKAAGRNTYRIALGFSGD